MAKRIGAIVSLSIIGVLILATIIMACVNVNYGIKCNKPTEIWVSYGSEQERQATGHEDAIIKYINNASKEKSLTALFNGTLGKKAEIKATNSKTISKVSEAFYVRYRYENSQKLMYGKKEFKTSSNQAVSYQDLVFEVKNLSGNNVVNVYVVENHSQANTYSYYYELEADFADLFNYLNNNVRVG